MGLCMCAVGKALGCNSWDNSSELQLMHGYVNLTVCVCPMQVQYMDSLLGEPIGLDSMTSAAKRVPVCLLCVTSHP